MREDAYFQQVCDGTSNMRIYALAIEALKNDREKCNDDDKRRYTTLIQSIMSNISPLSLKARD